MVGRRVRLQRHGAAAKQWVIRPREADEPLGIERLLDRPLGWASKHAKGQIDHAAID